jgi:sarcosine oxidase
MSRVIVIGLGAMGSATAQHLAQGGLSVLGFDQFTPPHTLGSSHGETRIIRQAYWEDWRYVPLLLRAYELWSELEAKSQQKLLHRTGGLMIGRPDSDLVARSRLSAEKFNLPHEVLSRAEMERRHPAFALREDMVALWEAKAGYLVPEDCVEQQLAQAARCGAELHFEEPALAWHAEPGGGVSVKTAVSEYTADALVITAGPWAGQVMAELGLPLTVIRQVVYWFEPQARAEIFAAERLPVYLFGAEDGLPLVYGFPSVPGRDGVKVALHGTPIVCTPATVDRTVHEEEVQNMRQRLSTTLPLLNGKLLRAGTCLYTMTPDEHFIVDKHPEFKQVSMAAGFSGHGFKFANVMGEILAGMASGKDSQFDLGLFALNRFRENGIA